MSAPRWSIWSPTALTWLEGVGMGQFCECHVLDDLRSGRLVRLLPDWKVADIPILAVYPDNRQIAAKVRAFVDFLARRLTPGPSSQAHRIAGARAHPRIPPSRTSRH
jgi:hypothetical protein